MSDDQWRGRDAWLGLLFLFVGVAIVVFAYLAMRNELPAVLWGSGWVLGPLLILLGANAVFAAVRAAVRDAHPGPPGA